MKYEVKKIDAVKRELKFEISKERVTKTLDEVYTELTKVAKVKGFRQGKVPRHVVEAQYATMAKEEMMQKLLPQAYHEAIEKEALHPIDMPEIRDVSFKNGAVSFVAVIDIKPEVKIGNYKGVKVMRKSNEVTEAEMDKTLEYFKQAKGGTEEAVTIDDAFAKGLGFPTLEDFKKSLKRQLEHDKERQNRADVENQIIEALLKDAKLTVPTSLVTRQLDHRMAELVERMKKQGISDEDIKKREPDMRKEMEKAVERDVRVYLVLDKIAQLENITAGENENLVVKVMELLMKEAVWEA